MQKTEQKKQWGKKAFGLWFPEIARCPLCKYPALVEALIVDLFPYQHTDLRLTCKKCGWKGVFGIPVDPIFGLELIIWDSNPSEVLKQAQSLEKPVCPYHLRPMVLTKIWGDKVLEDTSKLRVQWKCPEWYLVEHKTVKREVPSKQVYTKKEKGQLLERLRQLGYT